MSTKIKYLLFINAILMVGVLFSFESKKDNRKEQFNGLHFSLKDTANVDRIIIGKSELKKEMGSWVLNKKFLVIPKKIKTLLSIMNRLEVKRAVSESKKTAIAKELQKGVVVESYVKGRKIQSYKIGGTKENAYASLENGNPYGVHVPGFFLDIPKWFDIQENEWRDKRVLFTTWRSLKSLSVNYMGDETNSFKVSFDEDFFKVSGISELDSGKLYNYVSFYQNFRALAFLPQNTKVADSLKNIQPICSIEIEDIYSERNNKMQIYLGPKKQYGILENTKEIVELDTKTLRNVLTNRPYFLRKNN